MSHVSKSGMAVSWAQKEYQGYTRREGIMGNNKKTDLTKMEGMGNKVILVLA